jgi:hypothetical protein
MTNPIKVDGLTARAPKATDHRIFYPQTETEVTWTTLTWRVFEGRRRFKGAWIQQNDRPREGRDNRFHVGFGSCSGGHPGFETLEDALAGVRTLAARWG